MIVKCWIALLGAAALGAAAAQEKEEISDEPERCLSMASIRSTKVVDDSTVLFFHGRGRVYVNRLERECVGLARNGKFTFQVQTGARHARLCATDSITVLERTGRGFNCGLGLFEEISRDEAESFLGTPSPPIISTPIELPEEEEDEAEPRAADPKPAAEAAP